MNYVRKLGFEETPDYDFLRELFTKVLKTIGEPEDGVFDWMLLNNGKGWEAGNVGPLLSTLSTDTNQYISRSPQRHYLHKRMQMPHHPTRHIANTDANETTATTDVDLDNCRIMQHLPPHSFSAQLRRMSKAAADGQVKNEGTLLGTSAVFNPLRLQVGAQANNETLMPALVGFLQLPTLMRRAPRLPMAIVLPTEYMGAVHRLRPFRMLSRTALAITLETIMVLSRSCMGKGLLERPEQTRGGTRPLRVPGRSVEYGG